MKTLLPKVSARTALLLLCASVAACWKPIAKNEPAPETPDVVASTPAPQPSPPPRPTPAPPVVEAATPAPNYFAPPGVYFLVAKASIETANGITGLRPGTRLQQTGPTEYTDAEGHRLTLAANQVTNDLRIAQQVAGADVAAQSSLRQMQNARPAPTLQTAPTASTSEPRSASSAAKKPTTALGETSSLGPAQTRIQGGYHWERDANGNWRRGRPTR
jgi:hypothetical protein